MAGHPGNAGQISHPPIPPPRFWDNLSRPVLTKSALRELQRRIATDNPRAQADSQHRRYYTRHAASFQSSPAFAAEGILGRLNTTERMQVKRSARQGGPDLTDLRGCCPPQGHEIMPSPRRVRRRRGPRAAGANEPEQTTKTKSTTPYDPAFQQHLVDHAIFPPKYHYPNGKRVPEPENIGEIRKALDRRRASLSSDQISRDDLENLFEKFELADTTAVKECQVMASVIPIIKGDSADPRSTASDVQFSNLEHLTDGSLVCAKPDTYDGARPEELSKAIRTELENLVVPSTQHDLPVAPNNFLEVKGQEGSALVAVRQAIYDAALGSRGLRALQTYGGGSAESYDNKAYTLAWTYHAGHLKAYASHLIPPLTQRAPPGYAITPLGSWSLVGNPDSFCQGIAAYRNGRDWAKRQRDQAIAHANGVAAKLASVSEAAEEEETSDAVDEATSNGGDPTTHGSTDGSEEESPADYERPPKRLRAEEKLHPADATPSPGSK